MNFKLVRHMCIPPLGTVIEIIKPWEFKLHQEHRNSAMYRHFSLDYGYQKKAQMVTLPEGAKLKIERYYIKKNAPEYDSITFYWLKESIPAKTNIRFWAKLRDVNTIQYVDVEDATN